ncbi:MAG: OmpA family protein [Acetobacteraceae bacterium]|nr:OmpA family protein [Acetobacteraceae bacterium]
MARWRTALLATTLAVGPLAAYAQQSPYVTGPYVSLGAGYNLLQDLYDHPRLSPYTLPATRYRFGDGFVGAGSVGWGLGNGLRLEIEGAYDYNTVINRVRTALPSTTTGNQGTYGVFGNAFYDIDLTKLGLDVTAVQPYVGIGAGVLWTHFAPLTSVSSNGDVFRMGGTGTNFAYQGIVGFGFPIKAVPGLKLTTDYRFIGIQVNSGAVGESFTRAGLSKGTVDLSPAFLHQFTVGIAYAFYHPPPPPPPVAPAPAPVAQPTRTYLVFFDWDRADLTERARQIIGEAAQASTRVQVTRIEVNGYTDLSGTARYNQGLSVRRANAVAAELVRDGVPQNEIVARGFGESNPLVPTAQGVREPQNRRVEIILR